MSEFKKLSPQEVKQIELNALLYIKQICQQHNLRYYLAWGTLLGAVRHKGFIPWDDDIDIMMPRPDYERFLEIFSSLHHERYKILHNKKDRDYYYTHAKVVDSFTVCKEKDLYEISGMGVWIDVFPLDGVPTHYKLFNFKMRILHKLRALSVYQHVPKVSKILFPFVFVAWKLVRYFDYQYFIDKMESLVFKYSFDSSDFVSNIVEPEAKACVYRKEVFDSSVSLTFENEDFNVPILYDEYLKCTYGNYMKLPPIEKRVGHSFDAYWR